MVNLFDERHTENMSNMRFISDNSFHIEESPLYMSLKAKGIRSIEFVRNIGSELLFVEAKTSFVNPNNPDVDNYAKFLNEIEEICEKFVHSLNIYSSIMVGISEKALPEDFNPPLSTSLVFVLVIRNHQLEWCKPVYAKIIATLPRHIKDIWKPEVRVINHEKAISMKYTIG
jgi:hypothetical protein